MYKRIIKPLLFSLPPERAHHFTILLLRFTLMIPFMPGIFRRIYSIKNKKLERHLLGLHFSNPVGLAAGFDKDGKYFGAMSNLGFGFIELGTVTPKPQVGNPQPRLFRLAEDEALINRMGFNNDGVDALVARLKTDRPKGLIVGGNIGKNKVTPNEEAVSDYAYCFEQLYPYVDYFVVNVSSPNTPNLRALQEKKPLTKLLSHLQTLNHKKTAPKPILLKIAPDLSNEQLDDILEIVRTTQLDGIIAANTTISRDKLKTAPGRIERIGAGGLSGQPVQERSTAIIQYLRERTREDFVLIGVGGINSPEAALEKIKAGASLIQIYTGLIYEGPSLIKRINRTILQKINNSPVK